MTTQLRKRITDALTENGIDASDKLLTDLERATKPDKPITDQQQAANAILTVTGWSVATMYARAARLAKDLCKESNYVSVARELIDHYCTELDGSGWNWYRNDWRGQKQPPQRPSEAGIRETWKCWERPEVESANEPAGWSGLRAWASENGVALDGQD